MPEPPATPAVRAARQKELDALWALTAAVNGVGREIANPPIDQLVDSYRDAVAARVTEELLASGTPLWVATDEAECMEGDPCGSSVFPTPPRKVSPGGMVRFDEGPYGTFVELNVRLTPPGTVHQAVLLMKPEEPK